jgi:hypothetical protein
MRFLIVLAVSCALLFPAYGLAQESKTPTVADPELAKKLGADERGMRNYVLVILKTGPTRVPDGPARDEVFKGHMANIQRLADAGKLVVAGPFGGKSDWRGLHAGRSGAARGHRSGHQER